MSELEQFENSLESILIIGKMYNIPMLTDTGKSILEYYTDSLLNQYVKLYNQINGQH